VGENAFLVYGSDPDGRECGIEASGLELFSWNAAALKGT